MRAVTGGVPRAVWAAVLASALLKLALLAPAARFEPGRDEKQYLAGARSIVERGVLAYSNPFWDEAHASPVMPYFLAACYALFGPEHSLFGARFVQVLLSSLTVLLVYFVARRVFEPRIAAISAAVTAFDPTLVAYSHYLFAETLYIAFLLAFSAILLGGRSPTARSAFGAGLIGGVAALTRSAFLALVPLVVFWLLRVGDPPLVRRLRTAAALLAGMVLVIAPWTVRSTLRYGHVLLIDTNAGNVLYKNWNALRPENYDVGLVKRWTSEEARYDDGRVPLRPRVAVENIAERNHAEVRAAFGYVLQHPGRYLRNSLIRAAELVNPTSFLVRNIREERYGTAGALGEVIVYATVATTMAALLLGVVGLFARPPDAQRLLLVLLIAGQVALCVGIISTSRYRLSMMPLLFPFAVDGALHIKEVAKPTARRTWLTAGPIIAAMLVAWWLYLPYSFAAA